VGTQFNALTENTSGSEGLQVIGGTDGNDSSHVYSSSSNYDTEGAVTGNSGFELPSASFAATDTNSDGSLDQSEFRQFVQNDF